MARVGTDQTAFTDSRFQAMGRVAGLPGGRWEALGRMSLVWNECQERETYDLTSDSVADLHPDVPGFYEAMIASGLAREISPGIAYICGTRGRIEWLAKKRETARQNGAKGGRPANVGTDIGTNVGTDVGSTENQRRLQQESSPAPAPAPEESESESESKAGADAPPPQMALVPPADFATAKATRTRKAKPRVDQSGDAYRLAELFLGLVQQIDQNAEADLDQWARDLAPMVNRRGAAEVERLIRYARADERERKYTYSPKTLRSNATKIMNSMASTTSGGAGASEYFEGAFGDR